MAQFKKIAVTIQAVQWKDGKLSEVPSWISEALNKNPQEVGSITRIGNDIFIVTLEGRMKASDGDYILQGVEGEIYPCKPAIFERTYIAV